jgi:hypothetical protein
MTVSISLYNASDNKFIMSAYARTMPVALNDAINDAKQRVNAQRPTIYLRDCLGGLRAEVRFRDNTTTVKRT